VALILVIDPDVATSKLVSDTMARAGHRTRTAVDGTTAIKIAIATAPQLIICELLLPDVSGTDVLRGLRNYNVAAPLIMMSGAPSVRHVTEAMKRGAVEFLEKPVDVAVIQRAVDEALHIRRDGDYSAPVADRHSAQHWADVIIRAVQCTRDPRTLEAWARTAGVSVGAIRARCHIAGIAPKRSLNFARTPARSHASIELWRAFRGFARHCRQAHAAQTAQPRVHSSTRACRGG
jgi:FixJ family two-component response regulator